MKHFILIVLAIVANAPEANALFGHTALERQQRIATEQQLSQEKQRVADQQCHVIEQQRLANRWQTTAFVLGMATVVALIAGTAIGSRGRQHANAGK